MNSQPSTARFIRKKYIIPAIIILAVGGYAIWKMNTKAQSPVTYVTEAVQKGTLVSSVSGTGQVEASDQLDVKPQTDGRITQLPVKVNQRVKQGDVIAIIDQQQAANSLAQARASLAQAQANYDKLMAGATQNQIDTQQLSITSAQQALDQAKRDYASTVSSQQQNVSKALTALLNADLTAEPSDTQTSATVTVSGNYSGTAKGQYTISTYQGSGGLYYTVSGLGSQSGPLERGVTLSIGSGLYVTFSATGTISPSTTWTISIPNAKGNSYLNNLNAYNTAVQNQTDAVNKAQDSITSAQNNLSKAQLSYQGTVQPPTQADIASAKAQITSAQAQLSNAQTAFENTILTAPFDGVIAKLSFSLGDKVTAGTAIATIITDQQVAKISLNEVDAAKVKVGQKASLTFSAVPDLTATGKVADVDNIGTVSQNVVSFNVDILLDTAQETIKPGMSASASVITDTRQDVLMVPSAAIKTAGSGSYVQVLVNGKPEQRSVTTGLSNDTDTEISGNVQEGDEVVTQTISASASSQQSGTNILQSLTGNRNRTSTGGAANRAFGGAGGGPVIINGAPAGGR